MAPSSTRTETVGPPGRSLTRTETVGPPGRSLRLARALFAGALVFSAACGESRSGTKEAAEPPAAPVLVTVSVDWEGAYFEEDGLAALEQFRTDNPDVPLTHFICPAYYTKRDAVGEDVTYFFRRHIRSGDEVGLHLHPWNSLVKAARVRVRSGRSFLTADGALMEFDGDAGFDLDPSIYSTAELRAILASSRRLLEAAGLKVVPAFRAGAWLAAPNVLEAARAEGFTIDSSATDPSWLAGGESHAEFERLAPRLRALWPDVDRTTQPFHIDTPAGPVLEMPNSGGMADHVTSEEMEEHVAWAASSTRRPIFVHLGFHAETAHHFAPLLTRALASLRRRKVPIQFATLTQAAGSARAALGAR